MKAFFKKLGKVALKILLITLPTLIILALLLEGGVRLFLPVSDVPDTQFDPVLGNHYVPDQTGEFIKAHGEEIRTRYRINKSGWNSHRDYQEGKPDDVFRIAVIGDSYVEAFQVDVDRSFPFLLEKRLNKVAGAVEVYAYGHSGANLIQYLAVLRHAACKAHPDLVVVNIVPNDLEESLQGFARVDNWSVRPVDGGFDLVPPRPSGGLWLKRLVRHSALARYLIVNLEIQRGASAVEDLFRGDLREYEANVDVSRNVLLKDREALDRFLRYALGALFETTKGCDARLLLVLDANRQAIYAGEDPRESRIHIMNQAVMDVAGDLGVWVVDLAEVFSAAWAAENQRFDHELDGHWNRHGHSLVADAIKTWLISDSD
jgi:hypothetical protein